MITRAILAVLILFQSETFAADYYQIADGANAGILEHTVCQKVTNNSGQAILVPTKTSGEWSAFRNSSNPTGVTRVACQSAPTYVGNTNNQVSGGTSCTVNKHASLQVGDLMIVAIYEAASTATVTAPAGFTVATQSLAIGSGYYVFRGYKVADAGDVAASNFTFTRGAGWNECGIMMNVYRGVNTTTPVQEYQISCPGTANTTITYPSATATTAVSLSVALGETFSGTPSTPTGYTSNTSLAGFSARWTSKSVGTGATGTFTSTITSGRWCGTHFMLNPIP